MEIKKGDRFKCIENIFSTNSSNILFTVGKEYVCDLDNTITDNLGCCYNVNNKGHLNRYFLRISSTKAPEDTQKEDKVNHPSHYTSGDIECIDVMIAAYGKEDVMAFCKCNAFKYQWRFDKKNGIEDIKKAQWYQNKYIELENGKTCDS